MRTFLISKYFILTAGLFIAGLVIGWYVHGNNSGDVQNGNVSVRQAGYQFINPLLECELSDQQILKYKVVGEMKKTIKDIVDNKIDKGEAMNISIYYRDLHNGSWFSINENEEYSPASLLKVPIMIAAYKHDEKYPGFLSSKVDYTIKKDKDAMQNIKPSEILKSNKSYIVDDLINQMIITSENDPMNFLMTKIDESIVKEVFKDLDITLLTTDNLDDTMTVKDYAGFFRILYNSSYLNQELSEKALSLLSRVEYRDGLRAGVPDSISIAHKFGERKSLPQQIEQLHDCGIVYYPGSPYLLCIMTRGKDFAGLTKSISDISGLVYREEDNFTKQK